MVNGAFYNVICCHLDGVFCLVVVRQSVRLMFSCCSVTLLLFLPLRWRWAGSVLELPVSCSSGRHVFLIVHYQPVLKEQLEMSFLPRLLSQTFKILGWPSLSENTLNIHSPSKIHLPARPPLSPGFQDKSVQPPHCWFHCYINWGLSEPFKNVFSASLWLQTLTGFLFPSPSLSHELLHYTFCSFSNLCDNKSC